MRKLKNLLKSCGRKPTPLSTVLLLAVTVPSFALPTEPTLGATSDRIQFALDDSPNVSAVLRRGQVTELAPITPTVQALAADPELFAQPGSEVGERREVAIIFIGLAAKWAGEKIAEGIGVLCREWQRCMETGGFGTRC